MSKHAPFVHLMVFVKCVILLFDYSRAKFPLVPVNNWSRGLNKSARASHGSLTTVLLKLNGNLDFPYLSIETTLLDFSFMLLVNMNEVVKAKTCPE